MLMTTQGRGDKKNYSGGSIRTRNSWKRSRSNTRSVSRSKTKSATKTGKK